MPVGVGGGGVSAASRRIVSMLVGGQVLVLVPVLLGSTYTSEEPATGSSTKSNGSGGGASMSSTKRTDFSKKIRGVENSISASFQRTAVRSGKICRCLSQKVELNSDTLVLLICFIAFGRR